MKIRIRENTVRYRLSKSEVAKLAEQGKLKEQTEFVNGTLIYAVQQTMVESMSADFTQNAITLYVPKSALQQWINTEQVGVDCYMPLKNGNTLHLLLEKDFKCVDLNAVEDQSDNFENPLMTC